MRVPDGAAGRSEQVRTFAGFLDGLTALRGWLLDNGVTHVAMEATSSYWVPVWRVLEDGEVFDALLLCNARHVKHVPGRKTDVKDAQWLCHPLEAGLLSGSFVPPPPIRRLRVVTRYRKRLVQLRTSEVQRVEKLLEDAIVKIGSVASSTLTTSGRAMIEALIAGERDPEALADLAKAKLRGKIPELARALDSRFEEHHAVQSRQLLDRIDWFAPPSPCSRSASRPLPPPGRMSSDGCRASRAWDSAPLRSSWPRPAGTCPASRPTCISLRGSGCARDTMNRAASASPDALRTVTCGSRMRTPRLRGQRSAPRIPICSEVLACRGPRADGHRKAKAAIAVVHKIVIAAYYIMVTHGETYRDLGPDDIANRDDPERRRDRLVTQLTNLGYQVRTTTGRRMTY